MVLIPDGASQRNNFRIIQLTRPRIEREVTPRLLMLPNGHGWLCGDRRQALAEFSSLVEIERSGRP